MPRLPIGKNQHARAQLTNDACDLNPIAKDVLDAAVGNVERSPPTDFQDARSLVGLARPVFNAAARAHLALREVEDSSAVPVLRHLDRKSTRLNSSHLGISYA